MAMLELADMIANGETLMKEHANTIRKYVKYVGERDAGPNDQLKEENTKLLERVTQLSSEIAQLQARTEDYRVMRESAIRNQRANDGLREANTQLAKRNAELVKKHDEMVDLYAVADQEAKANKKALADMVVIMNDPMVKDAIEASPDLNKVEILEPNVPESVR
jgi:hypothetical protein